MQNPGNDHPLTYQLSLLRAMAQAPVPDHTELVLTYGALREIFGRAPDLVCRSEGCQAVLLRQAREENLRLRQWLADLQSGQYVNCVYCGHRYGPDPGTPVALADVLKRHIETCAAHPMAALKGAYAELRRQLGSLLEEMEALDNVRRGEEKP